MDSALIVDDHPVVVGAVRMVLESLGYKSIHVASSGVEVVPMIRAHAPKLIVLDLKLKGMGGLEVLERINALGLVCKIVIFSSADPDSYLARCRRAGAMAFVAKSAELQQLQSAIKAVRSGYSYFQELPQVSAGHCGVHSDEREQIERLSNRELHILVQLALGKPNKDIALEMNLSYKTISTYKTRLMLKLGIGSLVLLREFARRNHLL
ncbi:response regulator transcription factor [Pseudomonas fluorescens]|uniref:DNA-binding response regulator n=1 Tax=Pseudomonas fluorescens TaxID=294 RepID=A0A7Z3C3H4_PSEFL|nr:response regulator transcription factor [Pseudomonas fluorescens]QJP94852.1 DNA-binding response regulator [Pseudomonas fluorescens]